MRFPFKVALRFLKSNKSQTFLIVLGIAIGVSVQVFIGTLIQGLQKNIIQKTISNSSQITLLSAKDDKTIEDWERKVIKVAGSDNRIKNVSPSLDASGFIKDSDKSYPVLVRGFDLEAADKIYNIKNRIYNGDWIFNRDIAAGRKRVLIGRNLNDDLKKNVGDTIKLATPNGKIETFTISGFYDLKVGTINKSWVITDLKNVQNLFGFDNKITSIEAQIKDEHIFESDSIAKNTKYNLDSNDIKVENWQKQNAELLSALNGQNMSSIMIQFFVMISVVLAISSILAISVVQKSKEIGILKAMGIRDSVSSQIFLFEGLILGILGAIIGVFLGVGLTYMFTKFAVNPDGTPVVALYIDTKFLIGSFILAVSSAASAALIPARKSAKLNPIEVIKNG